MGRGVTPLTIKRHDFKICVWGARKKERKIKTILSKNSLVIPSILL